MIVTAIVVAGGFSISLSGCSSSSGLSPLAEGGSVIDIDSGSPCFALPDDFDVPREY
ncbi:MULTISPECIES: hypothetical protein [unclassified Curtobacterium]|uniref:hypothetical protein n=1 Tax=unclassified Curtobacterium TaxID=257496 RepID=UPI00130E4B7C|nr:MULTISPECIES: hypothetical protein [unclassified Curtobacterium]MCM3522710.1 hypothetical protein [Curtobacterium sp. P97]MDB6427364.1 hypothetical protein [Curtobacterium sp. 20TX0008]